MISNSSNSSEFEVYFEIRSVGGETNSSFSTRVGGGLYIYAAENNCSSLSIFEFAPILTNTGTATSYTAYERVNYLLAPSAKVSIRVFATPSGLKVQITVGEPVLLRSAK